MYCMFFITAMSKPNQDSYLICERFLNDPNCHVFGVFDGHGQFGDQCSHFAVDNVSDIACTMRYQTLCTIRSECY